MNLSGKNSFTPFEMSSAMEVVWWRREGSGREGGWTKVRRRARE